MPIGGLADFSSFLQFEVSIMKKKNKDEKGQFRERQVDDLDHRDTSDEK